MTRTKVRYWLEKGFLPAEASAFKNITIEAIEDYRYLQVMIETRSRRFREFYQKYYNEPNTLELYYKWVRELYVKNKFTDNPNSLLLYGGIQRRNKARSLAFDFFNAYKDKYAIRDKSGKLVETPRRKTRASKKPINRKTAVDQTIEQSLDDIKYSRFHLQYAKTDKEKQEWHDRIKRHQDRITKLRQRK